MTKPESSILTDLVGEVTTDMAGRCAILQKLAEMGAVYESPFITHALDRDFWRGVEDLMRANREDLERLYVAAQGKPR